VICFKQGGNLDIGNRVRADGVNPNASIRMSSITSDKEVLSASLLAKHRHPPLASVARIIRCAAENIGLKKRSQRDLPRSEKCSIPWLAAPCVTTTPFGVPVEPVTEFE